MRSLLLLFAAVLVLLVGVFPFVDDATRFVAGLPLSLVAIVGAQFVLIALHVALARRVRAGAVTPDAPANRTEEVRR